MSEMNNLDMVCFNECDQCGGVGGCYCFSFSKTSRKRKTNWKVDHFTPEQNARAKELIELLKQSMTPHERGRL